LTVPPSLDISKLTVKEGDRSGLNNLKDSKDSVMKAFEITN